MITARVKIVSYDKASNTCTAELQDGRIIELDPFVGCAIDMTDDEYEKDKGFGIVGNVYALTEYTVYTDNVVPHEGGMIKLSQQEW